MIHWLALFLFLLCPLQLLRAAHFSIAPFTADVTVPIGHGMMGGLWQAKNVADPLYAKGVVLLGGQRPVVFVSVDWCEIRNAAFDRWREVLAKAAGTTRDYVLVSAIHQHEAPVADLEAQRMLARLKLKGSICDLKFHETAVQRVAAAVRAAMNNPTPITHLGLGQAKVEKIASNRRYVLPDGKVSFGRGSASGRNVLAANAPEGVIDPWLKTMSFWNGDQPLAALSGYATHPMSYYRTGEISSDFPGLARARRQKDTPGCLQIYFSGASGNVTAGKYNTGARTNRAVLANRLYDGMAAAWKNTKRQSLTKMGVRIAPVKFAPRNHKGFTEADYLAKLKPGVDPWQQCLAAMGLSWRRRCERGQPVEIPIVDFGPAMLLLLPGESYVEFQLAAQRLAKNTFVLVAGYGESGTGYVPTAKHWQEKDGNLHDWCWVHPGAEEALLNALARGMHRKK